MAQKPKIKYIIIIQNNIILKFTNCIYFSGSDSLPEDIQELVTQALEEIHNTESHFS